jgi:phospholipase/carboxylesterase
MREARFGGLQARVCGGTDRDGGGDGPVVVLLHGFGAPGDDLVSLWRVLPVPAGTRFVFPQAPLALAAQYMGGRAWWMIDLARLERAMELHEVKERVREVPEGMAAARAQLVAMLDEVDAKLCPSKVVLGGFSQGAMLSCDVALRTERPLAGLVLLSGMLLAADEWTPLMPTRKGLPVLQCHGKDDPLLPFLLAERLKDKLVEAGLDVTWVPFHGGHAIPGPAMEALAAFLGKTLS